MYRIFLYIYLLLKPFYTMSGGGFQISDLFIPIAFIFFLISKDSKNLFAKSIKGNGKLLIYTILANVINLLYFIMYLSPKLLISNLCLIFIFIGIICFENSIKNTNFLLNVNKILKLNIVIQLIIFLLGLGRYYCLVRYQGTFNDPNQFGFYILLSCSTIYILNNKLSKKSTISNLLFMSISTFLIFQCASTGMFLGISIFLGLYLVNLFIKMNKKNVGKYIIVAIILVLFVNLVNFIFPNNFFEKVTTSNIVERTKKKVNNFDTGEVSFAQERGLDKITMYPQYVIFGAGEGVYERFQTYYVNEMHSTFPSMLFYYGIIPFMFVVLWFLGKLKNIKFDYIVPTVAIIMESFTLLNQRQLLFWVFFILIYYFNNEYKDDERVDF